MDEQGQQLGKKACLPATKIDTGPMAARGKGTEMTIEEITADETEVKTGLDGMIGIGIGTGTEEGKGVGAWREVVRRSEIGAEVERKIGRRNIGK